MFPRLLLLLVCISYCTTVNMPCGWYPSPNFKDVAMQCSGARVKHVPHFLPRSLKMLSLKNTSILSLDNTIFQEVDLPELTILEVIEGALASVGAHAFCDLPALTKLDLSDNQLELVDELDLSENRKLKSVKMSNNPRLRHLPRITSTSVTHLDADNCNLTSIDAATVAGMTALKVLNVTGNPYLHCPSTISQLKHARPQIQVICKIFDADFPSDQEHTTENSLNESDSAVGNKKENTTANGASHVSPTVPTVAAIAAAAALICVVILSPVAFLYVKRREVAQRLGRWIRIPRDDGSYPQSSQMNGSFL